MIERLSPLLTFKAASVATTGTFAGYASTFGGSPDSYGDIIAPGAFTETLAKHAQDGTVPAMFWAHDQTEPVGRWMELKQTSAGLEVAGKLTLSTRRGSEAYALMKDDALSMSIGYRIPSGGASYQSGGTTLLKQINLHEISLVALPANTAAKIISVKSMRPDNIRDLEAALHELGFSNREAKCIASKGWASLTSDQQGEELQQVAALLSAAAKNFN